MRGVVVGRLYPRMWSAVDLPAEHRAMRADNAARRARLRTKLDQATRAEEVERQAQHEMRAAQEQQRRHQLMAGRDAARQKVEERERERRLARAQAVIRRVRERERAWQMALLAMIRLQARVRGKLARRATLQLLTTRVQGRLCAQQAAWRARERLERMDCATFTRAPVDERGLPGWVPCSEGAPHPMAARPRREHRREAAVATILGSCATRLKVARAMST